MTAWYPQRRSRSLHRWPAWRLDWLPYFESAASKTAATPHQASERKLGGFLAPVTRPGSLQHSKDSNTPSLPSLPDLLRSGLVAWHGVQLDRIARLAFAAGQHDDVCFGL